MAEHQTLAAALAACDAQGLRPQDCLKEVRGGYAVVPPKKAPKNGGQKKTAKKTAKKKQLPPNLKKPLAAYAARADHQQYLLLTSEIGNPVHSKRYGAAMDRTEKAWEKAQALGATPAMRATLIEESYENGRKLVAKDEKKLRKAALKRLRKRTEFASYLHLAGYQGKPSEGGDAHMEKVDAARALALSSYRLAFRLGATRAELERVSKAAEHVGFRRARKKGN